MPTPRKCTTRRRRRLDECDKQALAVDENHRNEQTPDMLDDLRLVLRDRNHPSIVMWSLCNEAFCDGFDAATAAVLKPIVKELDPLGQRPVRHERGYDGSFPALDVMGINYHIQTRPFYNGTRRSRRARRPPRLDRGVYANDVEGVRLGVRRIAGLGNTAEDAW